MHVPCWNLPRASRLLEAKGYFPKMLRSNGYVEVLSAAAPA
jgi:fatty acid desaturase